MALLYNDQKMLMKVQNGYHYEIENYVTKSLSLILIVSSHNNQTVKHTLVKLANQRT